ncbi:Hpt domain-containing protein [Fusobacterium sp. IOR10]|uniref:Hpt domain-containing protein n=1 Tax=Fusobacterium sp. IOR10 TaxID=2665157 RepID=UPI0013D2F743|nr:Hpt domain-containing protein [Fusobacterium sp. IOR10]
MSILKELNNNGCDVKGALDRVLGDEELYIICLKKFVADEGFENLGKFIEEKDIEKAFNESHTLKGVAGNLGLTPLYDLLVIIVEKLRNNSLMGVYEDYKKMMKFYNEIKKISKDNV